MNDYRYPSITGRDPASQIKQIESYLRQLVDKMNMEQISFSAATNYVPVGDGEVKPIKEIDMAEAEATFEAIKALIIKSADIADSFYEKYSKKLSGYYVAVSDFGMYKEEAEAELEANAKNIDLAMRTTESIKSQIEDVGNMTRDFEAKYSLSAQEFSMNFEKIFSNGVGSVRTSTGYTFDADGLSITDEDSSVSNLIDHTGMQVKRDDDVMLRATDTGVEATDVKVNNYLIVGEHARFEDFPSNRTACFYV